MIPLRYKILWLMLLSGYCAWVSAEQIPNLGHDVDTDTKAVFEVLDKLHYSASIADGDSYFSVFHEQAIFLGTDASERWDMPTFKAFAHPYFAKQRGWTYRVMDRHIYLSQDKHVAWFDEALDNDSYGRCRGTGVLEKINQRWKISQYHLTIPIPNDLAKSIVTMIKESDSASVKPPDLNTQ